MTTLRRSLIVLGIALAATIVWLTINFSSHNLELTVIDDEVRRNAPGRFIETSRGVVHYEISGPEGARTVVLVHGFSVPYYLWDPTFAALTQAGYRVLRYDLFGRGLSDRPTAMYDADLFDRQLADLLDALKITGRVDLIGASMGGPIIATFACRHPQRVRTLSFFDPAYNHGGSLSWKLRSPVIGEYLMAVDIVPGLPNSQLADFKHPERFPDWPDRYRPQMKYKGFRRALLSTMRHYLTADWSSAFACVGAMSKPVFLVWGKSDAEVPFALSEKVRRAIPRAEFLPVDDAGHVPFIEHPEIVNPALLRFLAAHP